MPYEIHIVLTDNGVQFAWMPQNRNKPTAFFSLHMFDRVCHEHNNGSHQELKNHLQTFLMAYNFAKRLKVLNGLTSYEYICSVWTKNPERFNFNPLPFTVGLNT